MDSFDCIANTCMHTPTPEIEAPCLREIHVWRIAAEEYDSRFVLPWLSDDERLRAQRNRDPEKARQWIYFRAALRIVLSKYCDLAPENITLAYSEFGKPCLDPFSHGSGIRFNLSHCENFALVAVSNNVELGIDLEKVRGFPELEATAHAVLPPKALKNFYSVPMRQREDRFFLLWTITEALGKCAGYGWDQTVDLNSWPESISEMIRNESNENPYWISGFEPFPGHIASVAAAAQHDLAIMHFDLENLRERLRDSRIVGCGGSNGSKQPRMCLPSNLGLDLCLGRNE